ncbi:MAG: hypothetical protein LBR38_05530 [Synergistaceae bacterium]|jgi:hypothetical protein|nr:hypothetical protein [Synergistaceae bacterium]
MKRYVAVVALALALAIPAYAYENPAEETIRILEGETVFHWGRDCLVWVVHYPESLIAPWVEAEAQRSGMSEAQRIAFRSDFVSRLSLGSAEAFLFTVYAFGRSVNLSPLSDNVALIRPDGTRVKPIRYDRTLDGSVSGVAQGFVFFPKQDGSFALAVRGMGVHDERLFAFDGALPPPVVVVEVEPEEEDDVVIVDLPSAPTKEEKAVAKAEVKEAPKPPKPKPAAADKKAKAPGPTGPVEIERPTPPTPPPMPTVTIEPEDEGEETQSMAEFVEALRNRKRPAAVSGDAGDVSDTADTGGTTASSNSAEAERQASYISRDRTVRKFLSLWVENKPDEMYRMLSAETQRRVPLERFTIETRGASDFRAAVGDGYTLEWPSIDRVKVVAVQRLLVLRVLIERSFGLTREDSEWKIVW